MKAPVFKGSCTAMISPFSEKGIDFRQMGELLDFQAQNGTAAVLIAGTTGESPTLEIHEYDELVDFCVKYIDGRMKIIVGIGGNNSVSCLKKAKYAAKAGADAVIMTPPYYNKGTKEGLIQHFTLVADASPLPLILYNVPTRTVMGIPLDVYQTLAQHPNINGVKEASNDISLIARIAASCGGELNIWSGNDDNTVPMMALGACGVFSVASNVLPQTVAMLCALCAQGDFAAAKELYFRHSAFFEALFIETNPIPVKAAMRLLSMDSGRLRLPLTDISAPALIHLEKTMKDLQLL